jgi:hypothetical protein
LTDDPWLLVFDYCIMIIACCSYGTPSFGRQ